MKTTTWQKQLWIKYSPNYESFTSLFVSFIVHISLITLIMMLGWEGLKKAIIGDVNRRLGVSSVRVGGGAPRLVPLMQKKMTIRSKPLLNRIFQIKKVCPKFH